GRRSSEGTQPRDRRDGVAGMTAAATLDSGDAVISALEPPEVDESDSVKELMESAGWEVSAVDWVSEHVTGESLLTTVSEPLTGDFGKIAANAEAWGKRSEERRVGKEWRERGWPCAGKK